MPIQQVDSWEEAIQLCRKQESEYSQHEAHYQLSTWLARNAKDDYRNWNDIVRANKASVITPFVDTPVREFCGRHGVDDFILQNVRWDILGALMENEYLFTRHSALFFLELLEVYEAGHFPCGWEGEWPKGNLYVF